MQKDIFKSIGNKTRAKILACLGESDKTVTELINNCKLSQSAVSQHLIYLKANGLITSTKNGKYQIYSSKDKELSSLCKKLLEKQK